MKILIVSDTHKHEENLKKVLKRIGEIDCFIHLGDSEGREGYIKKLIDCQSYFVAGNNDYFSDLDRELEIQLGDFDVLLTHGHQYQVEFTSEHVADEARDRGMHIVMYGHTHRPSIDYFDDVVALNPGSLSYPRQDGRRASFIIMEIDKRGDYHFTVNYV